MPDVKRPITIQSLPPAPARAPRPAPVTGPWRVHMLMAAPHRLGFFLAMVVLVAASGWWLLVQADRWLGAWGLGYAVSPTLTHGAVMVFGFMPLFFSEGQAVVHGAGADRRSGVPLPITEPGATSLIVVQGRGAVNNLPVRSPAMIGFHELTEDEVFVSHTAARAGVTSENLSATEPLVILRYFGPEEDPDAPDVGGTLQ